MPDNLQPGVVLWFGKHRNKPLSQVPSDYLRWALNTVKLSSGVRFAVVAELQARGVHVNQPPAWSMPACQHCGGRESFVFWFEDSLGRRRLRADCAVCGRFLASPPVVPPWTEQANANGSQTPILDVLTRLEELGVELISDGKSVRYARDGWKYVPPVLNAIVRSCSHRLARLIGKRPEAR